MNMDDNSSLSHIKQLLDASCVIEAIHELDGLLKVYAKELKINQVILTLETLNESYPHIFQIESRLVEVRNRLGRKSDEA